MRDRELTRRRLLQASAASVLLAGCGGDDDPPRRPAAAAPTPACDDGDEATPPQTEGPYYTPDTPRRSSLLEDGVRGERLVVAGLVIDTACRPIGRALLDFWQADAAGEYDNAGFRLRGHQFTDGHGRFRLETVVPGVYPGRTRHIHVKAQRPGGDVLTTQLYFPGEPANAGDGLFDEALLMDVRGGRGRFTFVLA